jgi:hypothetical protein
MAKWKKATSELVTTDRQVRVVNVETGEEGYARLRWVAGIPRFYGSVYVETKRYLDDEGYETQPPDTVVLDAEPEFA